MPLLSRIDSRVESRVGAALPPLVGLPVHTRGTAGYSVHNGIAVPTNGSPRFWTIGNRTGIIMEKGATTTNQRSDELDDVYWTKTTSSVSANATRSPDGTVTGDKVVEDGSNAVHSVTRAAILTAGSRGQVCAYLKAGERTWGALRIGDQLCFFDLGNGVVGTVPASHFADITPVANGWYLCRVWTAAVSVDGTIGVHTATADGVSSYLGDGASGIFCWRICGVTPTTAVTPVTPHQTVGGTAARSSEFLEVVPQGVVGLSEGTIIVIADVRGAAAQVGPAENLYLFRTDRGGAQFIALLRLSGSAQTWRVIVDNAAATNIDWAQSGGIPTGLQAFAVRWRASDVSLWSLGAQQAVSAAAVANLPTVLQTGMMIGHVNGTSGNQQYGSAIYEFHCFDRALPDDLLATFTAPGIGSQAGPMIPLMRSHTLRMIFNEEMDVWSRAPLERRFSFRDPVREPGRRRR